MATPNHTKLQLELLCKEFTEAVEHISNSKTPFEEETQKRKSSEECSVLCCYVDDSNLDAAKKWKQKIWEVIKIMFLAGDPEEVSRFLGLKPAVEPNKTPGGYVTSLSQVEYCENMVKDFEERSGVR